MAEFALETERLTLRGWRESDVGPLHALCNDPKVMEFLGPFQSVPEIEAIIVRQQAIQAELGHCFWALERKNDGAMIGFCGLQPGPANTPIEGRVEIGWRLAADFWGLGYAKEAALAALKWGWTNLNAPNIWAITVPANTNSWGLMLRLGMARQAVLDFDHPAVPEGSALRRHMTWSIGRAAS